MLTIFAIPKSFRGVFGVIQRNAIRSWMQLGDDVEVIMFCENSEVAKEAKDLGARTIEDIQVNQFGTPLLNHVFRHALLSSSKDIVSYVNSDVILMSDFRNTLQRVADNWDEFLMIGRRHDLRLDEELDLSPGWESLLRNKVLAEGRPHSFSGIDYMVFNSARLVDLPAFSVGRPAWDNWFILNALRKKIEVVDASKVIVAVHQDHDYSHLPTGQRDHRKGPEAQINLTLAGDDAWKFSILSATRYLTPNRIRRPASIRRIRSQLWWIRMTGFVSNNVKRRWRKREAN